MIMPRKIVSDVSICHGKPCFEGTRVMVSTILDSLAEGASIETLVREYPPLSKEDLLAAIRYAAELAKGEEYPLGQKVAL